MVVVKGVVTSAPVIVTPGWKWLAVLIGLGVLALLYVLGGIFARAWNPWKLVEGADGRASTSKFQWSLWIVAVIFAYSVLWVLRAKQGDYAAISQIPANVLTVLGFSTGTAIVAKGITSGYVQTGRIAKPSVAQVGGATNQVIIGAQSGNTQTGSIQSASIQSASIQSASIQSASIQSGGPQGGVLTDDSGMPELAKIQMIGFTLISLGIFLSSLAHQVVSSPVVTTLPDIDSSLLVLMGISQGGYLGKKLVTIGTPTLYQANPPQAATGASVTLTGANLVAPPPGLTAPAGGQLLMNGAPVPTRSWSNNAISFTVPYANPVGGGQWAAGEQASVAVVVNGQTSNSVTLTVTGPPT
jgi:hypothetical protein